MKLLILTILKLSLLTLVIGVFPNAHAADVREERNIEDLAFGVALFDFYQGNNMASITIIEAAMGRNQINKRPEEAELLLGGLYFEYGLEQDAELIFNKLMGENLDSDAKNRVWFSLAKLHYAKNELDKCLDFLLLIEQKLSPQREAQKEYMLSNIYLEQARIDEAIKAAEQITDDSIWLAYTRYNIGVSLIASREYKKGEQWLNRLVDQDTEDKEIYALQDAANLALGMNAIKRQQPAQAVKHFSQIQLSSSFSNKALLGTGWAWSHQDNPKKALAYWQALQRREQTDIASQEVLLAIAHGIEQMRNKSLAIQLYEEASNRFDQILQEMNDAIQGVQKGVLMNTLSSKLVVQDSSFDILDETLSQIPSTPYLQPLFSRQDFQFALQQYQELLTIQSNLDMWSKNLPALTLMLNERSQLFEQKRPAVEQSTSFENLSGLQQKRDALAVSVLTIEQNQDYEALANESETEHLDLVMKIKNGLKKMNNSHILVEQKEKLRLLSGLLHWQISTDFPRRFYVVKNELKRLNDALKEASLSAQSLLSAALTNDRNLINFNTRITGQDKKIQQLFQRVRVLIEEQQQQINALAIAAIETRKQQLAQFRIKARYSLALLKDEMTRQQDN